VSTTPGPWIVVHELRDHDEAVCDLVNNTWVVKGHHGPLGNWNADANLISAAPELFDAADNALNALIACCVPAGGVDDRKAILEAQAMLRAAIKKATTGETA